MFKLKKIIIVFVCLFFTCENEKSELANDWMYQIDFQIETYEKTQTIKKQYKNKLENDAVEEVVFFKESKNGVSKIEANYSIENSFIINQNIFLKDKKLLFSSRKGYSPLVYKSRKKENDPCCSVSETKCYFYSKDSILNFSREKSLYVIDEFTTFSEVLKNETFEEQENTHFDYKYFQDLIEELNDRFPIQD